MNVQNIGAILHIIILTLILVWLFYHQWLLIKVLDLLRRPGDRLEGWKSDMKDTDNSNNREDCDFQLKQ